MSSVVVALITLGSLFGCALLGLLLCPLLPERHRGRATHKVVKLGVGMIVTVASLVLSLLTYSVKSNFDGTETNVRAFAASMILLDRSLRAYGPDADAARAALQTYTRSALQSTWPEEFGHPGAEVGVEGVHLGDRLFTLHDMIRRFDLADPYHREVAKECLTRIEDMLTRRFTLIEQLRRTIPTLMLWSLVAWLAVIFFSFGLNAPRNPVVLLTLGLCAVVISSSIYLLDEMDTPLNGIIKISSTPMRDALAHELR